MNDPQRTAQPSTNPDPAGAPAEQTVARDNEPSVPGLSLAGEEPRFAPPERAGELGTFGRYRVLKKLGAGGMGAVYLGYDAALERKVALKVVLPQYAAQPEARERFLREARSAAKVHSDHVVTIFDVGEASGVPFIAMEYLLGSPLDKYLKNKGELPLQQIVRVGRETALGLAAVHDLGMVHRDIKPGNIWLEAPKGRVKLLDFGLARPARDDVHITSSGAVVGTVAYMSPEQGRGLKVDHRSDLFSLGVLLYRLSTGRMPFAGDTVMALLTSLALDTPIPPRQINPQLPEALEAIIHRLLAKDPAARFQSAREVAEALRAVAHAKPVTGVLPALVAIPVQPMTVGAQTQNVWEGIEDSASVAVPMATSAEPAAEPVAAPPVKPPRAKPSRKVPKGPALFAGAVFLLAVGILAVVLWPKKPAEVVQNDDPNAKPPPGGKKEPTPPKDKGTPPATPEGKVYDLPPDLIAPMTPVKPAQVFTLDHLDPNNPKHIPPEEKVAWLPEGTVAVLGSHRQRLLPGQVNSLAVSPDGKTVLAGHPIPYHAIDIATGRILDWPLTSCFSPDGTRAASGKKVRQLADPNNAIEYPFQGEIVAFLTEDIVLVGVEGDHVVWKLDPKEPKPLARFDRTHRFTVSNDRKYLAVGFRDDSSCHVFDITAEGPKKKFVLPGEEGKLKTDGYWYSLSLSDTGLLATLDPNSVVRVWDVAGPKPQIKHTLDTKKPWGGVRIFPKGDRLVRWDEVVMEVWSVEGETPRMVASVSLISSDSTNCTCLAVTPDGSTILTGHINGAVRFWGIEKGVIFEKRPLKPQPGVSRYADFSPDGRFAALDHEGGRIHLWDLTDLKSRSLDWTNVSPARYAPDSATLSVFRFNVVGVGNGLRIVPSAQPGPPVDFANDFAPGCYSPDGKWLAAVSATELAIWDVSVSSPRERFARVPCSPSFLWRFTPDGRFLISANSGGTVKIWAMTERGPVPRKETGITHDHFTLSPDGKTVVFCFRAKEVAHYDFKDGVLTLRRKDDLGAMWADFSPDGRTLLVGGDRAGLKLIDAASGKILHEWTLRGSPQAGRFHPDGKHIFVTNANGTTYGLRLPKELLEKLAAETADRKAAEYVLSIGGIVRINGVAKDITAAAELPKDAFSLDAVRLHDNDKVTNEGLAVFKDCKNLLYIGLNGTQVGNEGITHLLGCPKLSGLGLYGTKVDDAGLTALMACKNLVDINLVKTKVTAMKIAEFRKELPQCRIHSPDGSIIEPIDVDRKAAEWVLSVGGFVQINGKVKDIKAAADLPKDQFTLTRVDLYNKLNVTDAHLVNFQGCKNIISLELAATPVRGPGFVHFKECKNLTSLSLWGTQVEDAGLAHFKDCKNLTNLALYKTPVSDAGLAHFKNCTNLTHLYVSGTKVTDDGLAHFKDCAKLTLLWIQETQVGDAGLAHLKGCKALMGLDARKSKVTRQGAEEFQKAVPGCRIEHDTGVIEPKVPIDADRRAAEYVLSVGGAVRANGEEKDIKAAAELPKERFSLTGVSLDYNKDITEAGLAVFAGCRDLTYLDLSNTLVANRALAHFAGCTKLTALRLTNSAVTDAGLEHFKNCTKLTSLHLSGTVVTDKGLEHFKNCSLLTEIWLNHTQVAGDGLKHFKDCKSLTTLCVQGASQFKDAGLTHVKGLTKLAILDLGYTQVTEAGLVNLKGCTELVQLNLVSAPVGNMGLEHIKNCTKLTHLSLGSTRITNAGLTQLKSLTELSHLHLDGLAVTDAGLAHIKGCAKLTHLYLGRTQIADAGLECVKGRANLEELGLSGTRVGNKGLEHLKDCTGLTRLHLDNTAVSDAGLVHLKNCTNLLYLDVRKTKVTSGKVPLLGETLPRCKIEHDGGVFEPKK